MSKVDGALLDQVEADVYWCLTKLLDNIQVRRSAVRRGAVTRVSALFRCFCRRLPLKLEALLLAALLWVCCCRF